jgi:hypothetical protein
MPPWPHISQADFEKLQNRIAKRFDRVAPLLIKENVGGFLGSLLRFVLMPGLRNIPGLIRDRALKFVRLTILADLVRRDQIQGWKLPDGIELEADDVRLVLGKLLNPSYDERNVAGIVKAMRAAAASDPDPAKGKPLQVWEAPWTDNHNESSIPS